MDRSVARKHEEKCGCLYRSAVSKDFRGRCETGRNSLAIPVPGKLSSRRTRFDYQSRWIRAKLSFPAATKERANSHTLYTLYTKLRVSVKHALTLESRVIRITIIKVISCDGLFTRRVLSFTCSYSPPTLFTRELLLCWSICMLLVERFSKESLWDFSWMEGNSNMFECRLETMRRCSRDSRTLFGALWLETAWDIREGLWNR